MNAPVPQQPSLPDSFSDIHQEVMDHDLKGYLLALVNKHPTTTPLNTSVGHIYQDLLAQMPAVEGMDDLKFVFCGWITEIVYPLTVHIHAQAVEITLAFAPPTQTPPASLEPASICIYMALDIGRNVIRIGHLAAGQTVPPELSLPVETGLTITAQPRHYHYTTTTMDRALALAGGVVELPVLHWANRNRDPLRAPKELYTPITSLARTEQRLEHPHPVVTGALAALGTVMGEPAAHAERQAQREVAGQPLEIAASERRGRAPDRREAEDIRHAMDRRHGVGRRAEITEPRPIWKKPEDGAVEPPKDGPQALEQSQTMAGTEQLEERRGLEGGNRLEKGLESNAIPQEEHGKGGRAPGEGQARPAEQGVEPKTRAESLERGLGSGVLGVGLEKGPEPPRAAERTEIALEPKTRGERSENGAEPEKREERLERGLGFETRATPFEGRLEPAKTQERPEQSLVTETQRERLERGIEPQAVGKFAENGIETGRQREDAGRNIETEMGLEKRREEVGMERREPEPRTELLMEGHETAQPEARHAEGNRSEQRSEVQTREGRPELGRREESHEPREEQRAEGREAARPEGSREEHRAEPVPERHQSEPRAEQRVEGRETAQPEARHVEGNRSEQRSEVQTREGRTELGRREESHEPRAEQRSEGRETAQPEVRHAEGSRSEQRSEGQTREGRTELGRREENHEPHPEQRVEGRETARPEGSRDEHRAEPGPERHQSEVREEQRMEGRETTRPEANRAEGGRSEQRSEGRESQTREGRPELGRREENHEPRAETHARESPGETPQQREAEAQPEQHEERQETQHEGRREENRETAERGEHSRQESERHEGFNRGIEEEQREREEQQQGQKEHVQHIQEKLDKIKESRHKQEERIHKIEERARASEEHKEGGERRETNTQSEGPRIGWGTGRREENQRVSENRQQGKAATPGWGKQRPVSGYGEERPHFEGAKKHNGEEETKIQKNYPSAEILNVTYNKAAPSHAAENTRAGIKAKAVLAQSPFRHMIGHTLKSGQERLLQFRPQRHIYTLLKATATKLGWKSGLAHRSAEAKVKGPEAKAGQASSADKKTAPASKQAPQTKTKSRLAQQVWKKLLPSMHPPGEDDDV